MCLWDFWKHETGAMGDFFEPLFYILQPWNFWGKNMCFSQKWVCHLLLYLFRFPLMQKAACTSFCKVRFTNDQQQWLNKFVMSPLPCCTHIIAKLSTNTTKILILNKQIDFFLFFFFALSTETSNSCLQKTKMCFFFPGLLDVVKFSEIVSSSLIPSTQWYVCFSHF